MTRSFSMLFLFFSFALHAQERTDDFLRQLLQKQGSPQLHNILQHPDSFRFQIIYTRIDRRKDGTPDFHSFYYRVNSQEYFNPASTVKMPLAFLALEKLDSLRRPGLDRNSTMLTDSSYAAQSPAHVDSSAENGLPSIGQYIRKIFLVSDNDAYNRLYEFITPDWINRRLWQMGYPEVRITRRFVPMNEDQNRHTNGIRFYSGNDLVYEQLPADNRVAFNFPSPVRIGQAHLDFNDSLIHEPMDFTRHNNLPLEDLQSMLQSVLFPESVPTGRRFHLKPDDYAFLYQYMSEYPSESRHPRYDTSVYYDSYTKFFLFKAGKTPIPPYLRIFNKPGWSYGFLTDAAYFADFSNKVEFMLSAVIYVNRDGILNDDKYEYDETGYPFFREIGQIIYQYELSRKRAYPPNLDRFKLPYH